MTLMFFFAGVGILLLAALASHLLRERDWAREATRRAQCANYEERLATLRHGHGDPYGDSEAVLTFQVQQCRVAAGQADWRP